MGWAARRPRAHSPQEQFETMRYASAADVDGWLASSETHEATLAALRADLAALDQVGNRRP